MKKVNRNRIIFAAVQCLFGFILSFSAQTFFSSDSNYYKTKSDGNNLISNFKSQFPDTSLLNFQNYFARNFMGNMGLPSPNYILGYGSNDLGFIYYNLPYTLDKFKPSSIQYVNCKGPFVNLTGIAGNKIFQIGKIEYAQPIADKLFLSLKLNRYTSTGYYNRQQTYTNNFYANAHFTSKNNRFGFYAYFLNNGNKNFENGGIIGGVQDASTINLNKALTYVNLSSASHDNQQSQLMFNPWLRLNKNDSTKNFNCFIQLKTEANKLIYRYKDLGLLKDGFYRNYYYDSISKTNDSTSIKQLSNAISFDILSKQNKFAASFSYKNEFSNLYQNVVSLSKKDSSIANHVLRTNLIARNFNPLDSINNKGFESLLNVQTVVVGKNSGNFKIESVSHYYFNFSKNQILTFKIFTEKRNADYIYNTLRSNNFRWNNRYIPQLSSHAEIELNWSSKFSASLLYQNTHNFLYFDANALPAQLRKTIENYQATINYSNVFFKHLGFGLKHVYQFTTKTNYVRLPQNSSTLQLYYYGSLFKNNLILHLGSQLSVYQSFKALAYMPSNQVFYLQNKYSTSAAPYLDVYLNARIRPVNIFIKVENVLHGLDAINYSFVPGYFQTDIALRFGISWLFFD